MRPPLACANCRQQKRRCDRRLPICTLCLRVGRRCSYRVGKVLEVRPKIRPMLAKDTSGGNLATLRLFLDGELHGPTHFVASSQSFAGLAALRESLSDDTGTVIGLESYASILDVWLPFIRWKQLLPMAQASIDGLSSDEVLLLACVKLLAAFPVPENPRTAHYLLIKSSLLHRESEGCISLYLLQAQLILHMYEFGHAIYPSAYLSLGVCIRYLAILGIGFACLSPGLEETWVEGESRRRLWWATYAMERAMALNCPRFPLWMEDPRSDSRLPSDEESWQQEAPTAHAELNIGTPATGRMGNFRLVAIASHLVSQVVRHVNGRTSNKSDRCWQERSAQLYRAICTLLTALEIEDQSAGLAIGLPRSLLNRLGSFTRTKPFVADGVSAVFMLHLCEPQACPEELYVFQAPWSIAADTFVQRARAFLRGQLSPLHRISPFLLHWGSQAFNIIYYRHRQYRRPEDLDALKDLESVFSVMEKRWKLAGIRTQFHLMSNAY